MSPAGHNPIVPLLLDLGARLGATEPEAERRALVEGRLTREGLEGADAVPAWLLDLLGTIGDRRLTEWIDFARGAGDDTNVLDFVRGLPDLLPMAYQNNEESWLLTFPALNVEACISFEGSCYKVSETGKTWD